MNEEERKAIEEEAVRARVKMVVLGQTGDGKSSLCNYIINCKDKFTVSDNPESETKRTIGALGEDNNVYIIDTPGLQDSHGTDLEHLIQMVDYIKSIKELNAIIIILNIHQPRLPIYINTMIKLFSDIFAVKDFWTHVAIVFTKCYYYTPETQMRKKIEGASKIIKKIRDIIFDTDATFDYAEIPKFIVDSDLEDEDKINSDQRSPEQIKELIAWAASRDPMKTSKFIEKDKIDNTYQFKIPKYEEILISKERKKGSDKEVSIYHGIMKYELIPYNKNEKVIFTDGIKIYQKKCYKTIIPEEVTTKVIRQVDEDDNFITIKEKKIIILDNGSVKEDGEWSIVDKKPKIKPKKLINRRKEYKTVKRQGFKNSSYELKTGWWIFGKTHNIPTAEAYEYNVKMERDVIEYDDGDIRYTDWSECS